MATDTVGTPRRVTLNGITYDVMGDANFSQSHHKYENEGIPTSGREIQKKTAKSRMVESVDIACNANEYQTIENLNDSPNPFPMSYEDAGGNVYRTEGFISIDSPRESETGKVSLKLTALKEWSLFAA